MRDHTDAAQHIFQPVGAVALTAWVDALDTSKANGVKSNNRQAEHRDRKKDGHVRQ
ncbi:hypothetical protein [Streptomyces sp. NPDC050564]|uniref:hypothetical protein n=1 Tax=Streptomyces sp. NPDC050564 TaxID=3365631 RepID=UPI0037BC0A46